MAKKEKTEKPAATKKAAKKVKAATPKTKKATKPKAAKTPKPKAKEAPKAPKQVVPETARVLNSEVVFDGPLFKILRDRLIEPGGAENVRDVIRHNGSVVILAIDGSKNKKRPLDCGRAAVSPRRKSVSVGTAGRQTR